MTHNIVNTKLLYNYKLKKQLPYKTVGVGIFIRHKIVGAAYGLEPRLHASKAPGI